MTVIHPHPHRLAMKVVLPSNYEIARTYGKVRVEDWDDRVSGQILTEHLRRGGQEAHEFYKRRLDDPETPVEPAAPALAIVRCHTLTDGQMILLHDDWLPSLEDL